MGQDLTAPLKQSEDITKKYAGFSPKQVEMIRERFDLMCDEDQSLDKETFAKLLKISGQEADILFNFFDMDQSGRIDSYEFICGLGLLSQSSLEVVFVLIFLTEQDKAEIIFNLYDFDKSQILTRNEMVILVKTCLSSLNSMSKRPPPTIKEVEAKVDEIIGRWDVNKDGLISKDEFKSLVSKDPDILKCLINYGLVNKEEMRPDFGGTNGDIPDVDSDLEEELSRDDIDDKEYARKQRIKSGIDYKLDKEKAPNEFFEQEHVDDGDQFMAVKPWVGTVKATVPTTYVPKQSDSLAPEANLDLEYVYGYRCHDTRNNLRYNQNDEAVYHTAAVGISLDGKSNKQRFFIQHTDDITCLDICGNKVVTGQMGKKPLICVWDSISMSLLTCFNADLQNSITNVCISSDGKLLAAIANDPDHSMAIYNLEKFLDKDYNKAKAKTDGSIILGKGPKAQVLDMRFDPSNKIIAIACVKEVDFVTFEGGMIKVTKGSGWAKNTPLQAITSIAYVNGNCLTGSFSGSIFIWKGTSMSNVVQGHSGCVNSLWARANGNGFISGGNDGQIIIWDSNIVKKDVIDIKSLAINSMNPKIRSICDNKAGNILFGTRGGEIIEYVGGKANVLMRGHFDAELWGLCTHSKKNEFFTVGQDTLLASWDIASRKQKLATKLDYPASVVAMSADEKFLAVGCKNGFVLIMNPTNFSLIQTLKDRDQEVSEIKFSPNSELLAVGAHDSEIFIYNVKKNFKIQCKARGHHSTIKHLDFSKDSQFFQSNCTSYELLFFSTVTGKRQNAPQFKDEGWDTYSTVIGWAVQGIWPECSKGSDINALDRHPANNVLATVDDFSQVKLFKFPCPVERSAYNKYIGHSSHVTNVKFTKQGNYLLSTGGNDKAIFQWKYDFDNAGDEVATNIHQANLEEEGEGNVNGEKKADDDALFKGENIEGGDEALAIKPFKGQVEKSTPSKYRSPGNEAAEPPNGNLTLKYCLGFRSFDARNGAKYTNNPNNIVFIAASLGITMDINTKAQGFFNMHEDDVICLAIHPNKKYAATGQMAHKGKAKQIDMFVWDIENKTMLSKMNNFHLRAVCLIEFSPDGSKIVSYGRDDNNSLAVYDWQQGLLLATSKVDQAKVTASGWKSETEFFSCGLKHVKFWTLNGKNINNKRGILPETLQNEAFLCGTYAFGGICVCGTQSGTIIPFNGGNSMKAAVNAHKGAVWIVAPMKNNLISGGQDGKVIIWSWTNGLNKVSELCDMTTFTAFHPGIVSIDLKADGETVLVGTRGGEIHEVSKGSTKVLMQSHYDGELWGLACCPNSFKFVTCGGDSTIRLWDVKTYSMITASKPQENDLRAIDWSLNGQFIVAGDMKGKIICLDPQLKIQSTLQSSFIKKDQWIEDIKISPDNTMVAFGAHGGRSPIEVMQIQGGKTLQKYKKIEVGLSSALLHLDWATDSSIVVVNSQAYELMFVNIQTEKQVTASATTDMNWHTWTCKFGWCVQGVFKGAEYFATNTVDRSHNQKVLVTGDDDGLVNLYKYPSLVEHAHFKSYLGHSSHVTRTRFTYDDSMVMSTGGNDKAVLIWDTDFGIGHPEEHNVQLGAPDDDSEVDDSDYVKKKVKKDKFNRNPKQESEQPKDDNNLFQIEKGNEGGDEFMAVKPWVGQIKEPTGYKKPPLNHNKAPKADLTLDYVHGYRAKDCKNNIRYLKTGNIVYHAAAVGIVLDSNNNTQRHFTLHIDDITSMDVHPNGVLVATGEIGPKPTIYVWDSNTMQAIFTLKGLEKGICNLGFSPSGSKLVACAVDDNHSVAVFDTEVGALVCKEKGDVSPIVEIAFKNDNEFVSIGPKHYMYWAFQNKSIKSKRGTFGNESKILKCVAFNEDAILVGAADGKLQIWNQNSLSKAIPSHNGALDALWVDGQYVITGGSDGIINLLDKTYQCLIKLSLDSVTKTPVSYKLRSVCLSADKKTLLIGTLGSEIYELSTKETKFSSTTKFASKDLIKGHYTPNTKWTNEVWGLCIFNDGDKFATCSDDATLRIWSTSQRKMIKLLKINTDQNGEELPPDPKTGDIDESAKARAVDITHDDKLIAVGCKDGTLRVVDVANWKQIKIIKHAKAWIQEVKFSPDGSQLAVGSHDDTIYIYQVPGFQKKWAMKKHSSYITHMDWSKDGNGLHSTCGAYELLYWDITTGQQVKSGATQFRDEQWATWTATLGWPVQGIWPPETDGTDINYVDRTHNKTAGDYFILASGDDFSTVKLFRYPSIQKGSESVVGKGHSSHVTCVKFGQKDDYLYSTGGEDNCVFQWRVSTTQ